MKPHIDFPETTRSYATYNRARLEAEKVCEGKYTYIIMAGSGKNEGRFIPAFIGADANHIYHKGFPWIVKA